MTSNVILTDQSGNLSTIGFPEKIIIMWYGNKDKIPPGWVACDGKNGTPDLRGQFVRMYSDDTDFGTFDKGIYSDLPGKDTKDRVTLKNDIKVTYGSNYDPALVIPRSGANRRAIFKHEIGNYGGTDVRKSTISEFPTHMHDVNWGPDSRDNPKKWETIADWRSGSGKDFISIQADPNFGNAGVKILPVGEDADQNNQPPYYVLTYIMKKD